MSLKTFHIFFISVSVLLCLGFGVWCFDSDIARGQTGYLTLGLFSLAAGLALIVYEIIFLRKFRKLP